VSSANPPSPRPHQRAIKAAFWSLNSYLLPLLVTLLAMPLLYRKLGAAEFGVYTLALLAPAIASNLDLGLASASVRRTAGLLHADPARMLGTVVTSFGLSLALVGAGVGLAILCATPWLGGWLGFTETLGEQSSRQVLMLCALWAGLTPGMAVPGNLMRAAQLFGPITIVQTVVTIATWGGALALVMAGAGVVAIVALALLVSLASALAYAVYAWPLVRHLPLRVDWTPVREDIRFSGGLFLMQLASMVAYQIDRVVISALLSPAAAGSYALCANLANKLLFTVSSLTAFAFPRAAAMAASGETVGPSRLLQMLLRNLLPLVASTLVPAMLLAEPFFKLWLGSAYQAELPRLFQLLWLGFALASVSVPASHIVIGLGASRLPALFAWLTAVTSIALLVLLLPRVGLVGAGGAAIGAFSTSLLFVWFVHRTLRSTRDPELPRVLAGCALGSAAQLALLWRLAPEVGHWIAFIALGGLAVPVFYAVRLALRCATGEESRLLKSALARLGAQAPLDRPGP
jgi:O-antigen/teichoic acid export membrane protein